MAVRSLRRPFISSLSINQLLDALAQCASEHLCELVDPDPDLDEEDPGDYRDRTPKQQGRRLLYRAPLPRLRRSNWRRRMRCGPLNCSSKATNPFSPKSAAPCR